MSDDAIKRQRSEMMAALEIAAHLPTAARCQAFVRAYVEGKKWAVDDVANHMAKDTRDE